MNQSERFYNVFRGIPDRIPVYFFGTWPETKEIWYQDSCPKTHDIADNQGPNIPGMDPDWETGMWNYHGLVNISPIAKGEDHILEETNDTITIKNNLGDVIKYNKGSSSIPMHLEHALKGTYKSWENYKKYLDPEDPTRWTEGWIEKAVLINEEDRVKTFMGGSAYGHLRNVMGVKNISFLMYDDPDLLKEMLEFYSDYMIKMLTPVIENIQFDLVYFFEDCCGSTGPLFSPEMFDKFFASYYNKMLHFYKAKGIPLALVDSDGLMEPLVGRWIDVGFDIIFPLEVGKWEAHPDKIRKKYGKDVCIMGGVDKRLIEVGGDALKNHLVSLKKSVDQGGYLPIPDHRIPPTCSYQAFLNYIDQFQSIFNNKGV